MSARSLPEATGAGRPTGARAPGLDPRFARPRTLFFCIGAQKTATSWLHVYLRGHPEVCLPVHKEQHYWTNLRSISVSNWAARIEREAQRIETGGHLKRLVRRPRRRTADRAWLLMRSMLADSTPGHRAYADVLFQTWRGEPVVGEITPAYALLPAEAFAEMAELGHDVRFVFILRDPISRLISGARMSVRHGGADSAFLQDAEQWAGAVPESWLARSRYDMTIKNLEAAVSRERIAYFFYESLLRQPEIDRLCDFLGVARRPAQFERRVHADPGTEMSLPPNFEARAMEALAPTYEFVRERFGDLVPATWRKAGGA